MKQLTIGLIGNPNSGKTTLFNQLTGSRQRVGNWAGVTVERKEGSFSTAAQAVKLVDLPGTYSLTTISSQTSLDEQIACHYILGGEAGMLINVIDASNLERNLYLTLQLLELGIPCIVVLNMLDIAEAQNITLDIKALSSRLGCPVVALIATRTNGLDALLSAIDQHPEPILLQRIDYPAALLHEMKYLAEAMPQNLPRQRREWLAIQMLEGDIYSATHSGEAKNRLDEVHKRLIANGIADPALAIAEARYKTLTRLGSEVGNTLSSTPHRLTQLLDKFVLNRFLGVPIFLLVMYLMFVLAINIGGALKPLFEIGSATLFVDGIQWLGHGLQLPTWLTLFLAQGVGGGISTVMPLIPQIGMMYLFLSFLEDSGYMARAAFVMDRLMQSLGLPGKSFVPLIVGFGCNVPSILGARTLDAPRERLITVMMAPFMSCGARLAIFAVFSAAFFGQSGASIVFSLYLLGIAVAVLTGLVMKHTVVRGEASPFIMELPVYHIPQVKTLLLQTWQRLQNFVLRAGKVIVIACIFIGALNSFSFNGKPVDSINDSALASVSRVLTPVLTPMGVHPDNWQATVGLITGAMAKEVVVGTLNTLYTAEQLKAAPFDASQYAPVSELRRAVDETWSSLLDTFSFSVLANPIEASKGNGEMAASAMGVMSAKFGSAISAYSYLIFVLLYVPCVSVMGAIARETNRSWMMFSILWGLNVAWSLATLFYQSATLSQHPLQSATIIAAVLLVNALILTGLRCSRSRGPTTLAVGALLPSTGGGCKGCAESKKCGTRRTTP
ncbi:Fe(2+) transporter permease subunit FeoB [Serratia sp. M24T3]|uniref:Fe(2+) transporter permease subunit FeoB n=1 Tax=Serratia sp. M24T3 TaxID=932213 RepID=UPI00025BBE12|nr:Fe(2+) transporter permease subunit FeoB [Serratia sp. M24T3]EIC85800.1 ferrous iron transport protein B [Serratia sp. M24T3]